MEITAQLDDYSLKGVGKVILANIETVKHKRGLLILEIAGGSYVSINLDNPDFFLVTKEGDFVSVNLEWTFNKEMSVLTKDIFASGDQKEFTTVEVENLSHVERKNRVVQFLDVQHRVIEIADVHLTT